MNGSVMPEQVSVMEFGAPGGEALPPIVENDDPNDLSRLSEVFETIAPARGVAIQ